MEKKGLKIMTFTIKESKIKGWGYEITTKQGFHNIAPSIETAVNYLKDRYGHDVKYKVIQSKTS